MSKTPLTRRDAHAYRPAFVRLALAFLASFVALGYFAALSHMAFVAHAACAEHGKLVHVQSAAAGLAGDADPGTAADASDAVASDEHDHCVPGTAQPGDSRVAHAALAVVIHDEPPALPPLVLPKAASTPVGLTAPIPILLLSPKSSPPA